MLKFSSETGWATGPELDNEDKAHLPYRGAAAAGLGLEPRTSSMEVRGLVHSATVGKVPIVFDAPDLIVTVSTQNK